MLWQQGLKARNTQILDVCFCHKNPLKSGSIFFNSFLHSLEKISLEFRTLKYKIYLFGGDVIWLIHTHMKVANLSWTSPNMSSIGGVCSGSLMTSLVGNHWAFGRLRVNSTPDHIFFALFLLEGNTILQITHRRTVLAFTGAALQTAS